MSDKQPNETFPPSPETDEAIASIAMNEQCDPNLVNSLFDARFIPAWTTVEHFRLMKQEAKNTLHAAKYIKLLINSLKMLSVNKLHSIYCNGSVTIAQLEILQLTLSTESEFLDRHGAEFNRTGGRNPAAHATSEMIRRLYRKLGRRVTYGQTTDAEPSTNFCRSVEFALDAFRINANWRRPARCAFKKNEKVSARLQRCEAHKMTHTRNTK